MKRLLFTLCLCLISLGCIAQQTIKTTKGYNGEIPYVSSKTFDNSKINNNVTLRAISETQTVQDVIDLLGEPTDIKNEKDTAVDGTILFETKILNYPGFLFVFTKKEGKFRLSRIDLTTPKSSIQLNDSQIKIGMSLFDMPAPVSTLKKVSGTDGMISIAVAKENAAQQSNKKQGTSIEFSSEYLKLFYDTNTNKINKVSIYLYRI